MIEIIKAIYNMLGADENAEMSPESRTEEIFRKMDTNGYVRAPASRRQQHEKKFQFSR